MANIVKKDLHDAVGTEVEILDVRIPRLQQNTLAAQARAAMPPPDLPLIQVPRPQ